MTTSIQSACDAPEQFKNRGRAVFLQPVRERVELAGLRQLWAAAPAAEGSWTFRGDGGFLSVARDGGLVDLFPVDDGSGRQRWDRVPQPGGAVALRVHAGLDAGAPAWLTRLGNLKVCLRRAVTPQGLWRLQDSAAPPAQPSKPPQPAAQPAAQPAGLRPRDVLLAKRGRALGLLRESRGFCIYADAESRAGQMQAVVDYLDRTWAAYLALGFAVRPSVAASQGWDAFKKPVYLGGTAPPGPCGGCPESGHGYEFQGWDDAGHAFLCTGGFGAEGGCVAHELGHLMQVATGGFTWGGTCPWAWESAAQFMRWHGCAREEDAESLVPWLRHHAKSLERHDGSDAAYPYGSWLWWVWLDAEFGAGSTGRAWSTAAAPESPLAACARVAGVALPDLFARWVAALLAQTHTASASDPRWARVNAHIGHGAGWATFERVTETPAGYVPAAADLETNGFHALRLADGARRGEGRLRLDCALPDARLVVVVPGGGQQHLRAGEASAPVPLGRALLGVCCATTGATAAVAYSVAVVAK